MRKQVQLLIREQHRRNQDSRHVSRPLTVAAEAMLKQSSAAPHLPANDWFGRLFKRHPEAGEGSVTSKDVDRTRCTDPNFLADDLSTLQQNLYDAGKVDKDGKWVKHPGPENDDKIGRSPGCISRAAVFQCDEKGQFFFYNVETGRLSRKKCAHAAGEPAVVTVVENRTCFTYVPWANVNGDFLCAQVIYVGAGVCASHLCEGLPDNILIQHNDKGQQDGDTRAQALEFLNKILIKKHDNHPLICGANVVRVNTTDGHHSRKELVTLEASIRLSIHNQHPERWGLLHHADVGPDLCQVWRHAPEAAFLVGRVFQRLQDGPTCAVQDDDQVRQLDHLPDASQRRHGVGNKRRHLRGVGQGRPASARHRLGTAPRQPLGGQARRTHRPVCTPRRRHDGDAKLAGAAAARRLVLPQTRPRVAQRLVRVSKAQAGIHGEGP